MTELSIHDLQPQLTANRRYWTGWSGAEPDTDLPIYRTDIAHPLLNGVLRVRGRRLDEAIAEARRRLDGSVWAWWVGIDSDEGTAAGLLARGFQQIAAMPIMAIDVRPADVPEVTGPPGLAIHELVRPETLTDYVTTYAGPLGIDPGQVARVVECERDFAYPEVVRLAGSLDGKIVGTCTLSLGTEVAALYCIATDPEHRRSGIATALTLAALRLAREAGRTVVTLQASAAGQPVYQRIGFETVGGYALYALPA